jgi:translation initiation factor 4G
MGELFRLRLLSAKFLDFCISKQLKFGYEEQLECLCKLISTIGQTYEEEHDTAVADARVWESHYC